MTFCEILQMQYCATESKNVNEMALHISQNILWQPEEETS